MVGPAHFSGSANSYLIADYVGFTGYGTDVLSVRGIGDTAYGVGLATSTTAIGFRFGAFTGEMIDIVLQNGSVLTQAAPVDALFLGLVSDTPISGIVFRSAGVLNLDIIGFTIGSADIPEPVPLAVLGCAMAGLCLTRRRIATAP